MVEVREDHISLNPPESKNTQEYFDCGPGKVDSGTYVSFEVHYISFGHFER